MCVLHENRNKKVQLLRLDFVGGRGQEEVACILGSGAGRTPTEWIESESESGSIYMLPFELVLGAI